jgi:hypothetical protein
MACYAVGSLQKRFMEAVAETAPALRKNVEIRLPSHCRLARDVRTSGTRRARIIFYESGHAGPVGAVGLMVDVAGVDLLTPAEAQRRFPKEVGECEPARWKVYSKARRLCCITLGDRRQPVDDIVLLRPLNVWLQRQVSLQQRTLMFCKRDDLGKTIKLPFSGGRCITTLQIAGYSRRRMPAGPAIIPAHCPLPPVPEFCSLPRRPRRAVHGVAPVP